ncbi:hypothetical protein GCWU000342_01156 [Shuttleworthella satelles DSM 14600]|uniref:Uncharacterized protein n=1 Tax=Shuttleworthella satelles DSM 14600 TaxID=626523 RepID=C4GB54_9FIRM|nr:hypothetical protein GCWU000342_01156 [Shuttleworthia satelles DSM 14600]
MRLVFPVPLTPAMISTIFTPPIHINDLYYPEKIIVYGLPKYNAS